jgi:hypothetical protein
MVVKQPLGSPISFIRPSQKHVNAKLKFLTRVAVNAPNGVS